MSKKNPKDISMCTLNNLRKVTRSVSKIYDASLSNIGLRSTQFSLLSTIEKVDERPISQLAEILVMDRTTLTRNLKPLADKGLIKISTEGDMRIRCIQITKKGSCLLEKAKPYWEKIQLKLVSEIGEERWSGILDDLSEVLKITK